MATKTTGLHERPTYNKLIREIQHGEKIKLPNRDALFLRNSPYLAFLDGQGTTEMAEQQERVQKQVETEHVVREQSGVGGVVEARVHRDIKEDAPKRVGKMLRPRSRPENFSMASSDASMDETAEHPWKPDGLMEEATGGGGQPPDMGGGKGKSKGRKGKSKQKKGYSTEESESEVYTSQGGGKGGGGGGGGSSSAQPIHVHVENNYHPLHHDPQLTNILTNLQVRTQIQGSTLTQILMENGHVGPEGVRYKQEQKANAPGRQPSRATEVLAMIGSSENKAMKRNQELPPELIPDPRSHQSNGPPAFMPHQPVNPQISPPVVIPPTIAVPVVPVPARGRDVEKGKERSRSRSTNNKTKKAIEKDKARKELDEELMEEKVELDKRPAKAKAEKDVPDAEPAKKAKPTAKEDAATIQAVYEKRKAKGNVETKVEEIEAKLPIKKKAADDAIAELAVVKKARFGIKGRTFDPARLAVLNRLAATMVARREKADLLLKEAKVKQADKEYDALMKDLETMKRKKKELLAIGDKAPETTSTKKQKIEEIGDKEAEPPKKTAHSGRKRGGSTVRVMPPSFLKKPVRGTTGDNDKRRSHWAKKPVGYIKEKLEQIGHPVSAQSLKGPTGLKKTQLLQLLYSADKNIV